MGNVPFDVVKEGLAAGTAKPSVMSELLEELSQKQDVNFAEEEDIIRAAGEFYLPFICIFCQSFLCLGASSYSGGSDTTVAALHTFFLAMTLFPEVQQKAQAELDAILCGERMPEFEDREKLPYINALIKEVIRWYPILPMGIAHSVSEDDVVRTIFLLRCSSS